MTLPILLLVILFAPMLWAMARGKDLWPFSSYPMFSRLLSLRDVEVFRLALETTEAEVVWWRSEFYRYPELVGRRLKRIYRMEQEGGRTASVAQLERQRLLNEVLRLIDSECGGLAQYQAFRIVRRTLDPNDDDHLSIDDQLIARIPFQEIKRINRAG